MNLIITDIVFCKMAMKPWEINKYALFTGLQVKLIPDTFCWFIRIYCSRSFILLRVGSFYKIYEETFT